MTARKAGAWSTPARAMFLTWKQADVLIALSEGGPQIVRSVADTLREVQADDARQGRVLYKGVGYAGAYGSLRTLRRRGLVDRRDDNHWVLTDAGYRVLAAVL